MCVCVCVYGDGGKGYGYRFRWGGLGACFAISKGGWKSRGKGGRGGEFYHEKRSSSIPAFCFELAMERTFGNLAEGGGGGEVLLLSAFREGGTSGSMKREINFF